MKKIIHKLHLWLSIPIGLIITIICLSGATLVFETELTELFNPSLYKAQQTKDKPIPLDKLIEIVNDQLPDTMKASSVTIPVDPAKNYRFGVSGKHRFSIFVDPYSGEVKGDSDNATSKFFTSMRRLHRWLLDEYKRDGSISVGKTIVGVCTLIFVFILITGIISWIPKTRKVLKRGLKINFNYGLKRFWHDLHIVGGVYAVIILLILSLTGLTWSFTWYRTGFYALFGVEMQQAPVSSQSNNRQNKAESGRDNRSSRQGRGAGENSNNQRSQRDRQGGERGDSRHGGDKREKQRTDFSNWQQVADNLIKKNDGIKSVTIQDGRVSVSLDPIIGNMRSSDSYSFDPQTGEITEAKLYKDQEKQGKIRGWIYSVHVGSWGGIVTKIITFLASLLGASLPITGYYIWIKKGIAKRKNRKRKKLYI